MATFKTVEIPQDNTPKRGRGRPRKEDTKDMTPVYLVTRGSKEGPMPAYKAYDIAIQRVATAPAGRTYDIIEA